SGARLRARPPTPRARGGGARWPRPPPAPAASHAGPSKRARRWFPNVAAMDITLARCFIQVNDADLALAFYRDVLGLEVRNDVSNEGFRWITVGAPSQPGVEIVLTNYLHGSRADGEVISAL